MPRTPDLVFVTRLVDAFFVFSGAASVGLFASCYVRRSATMGQMLAGCMLLYNSIYWIMMLRALAHEGWCLLSTAEKRE
jgi:hypothetical protein